MANAPANAPALQAATNNIGAGVRANQALITATNNVQKNVNINKNMAAIPPAANTAALNYAKAANNLRKANMNRAANSFENAAKKAHVGDGVGAAKSAGSGLRAMLKTNSNNRR
jgi:hypothetical protein